MSGFGDSLTRVSTTQDHPLGTIVVEPASQSTDADQGERHWIYIFNDEAATAFAQGEVAVRDAGTVTYDAIRSAGTVAAHRVIGVAQHAIAFGSFGFVLKKGIGEVEADGSITADSPIMSVAAGRATDMTAGNEHCVFGFSTEIDAGAGSLITAYINCPG